MKIEMIKVGDLRCNCYILSLGNDVLVIDPGDDFPKIVDTIGERHVIGILITHGHFDHTLAMPKLKEKYNCPVYDYFNLTEKTYDLSGFKFSVIRTPGHDFDCISFYFKDDGVMFTGDFLFFGTIGRCDLPGSDTNKMKESLLKVKDIPNDVKIYPGHGKFSSFGHEKAYNPYLQ